MCWAGKNIALGWEGRKCFWRYDLVDDGIVNPIMTKSHTIESEDIDHEIQYLKSNKNSLIYRIKSTANYMFYLCLLYFVSFHSIKFIHSVVASESFALLFQHFPSKPTSFTSIRIYLLEFITNQKFFSNLFFTIDEIKDV